ncbi:MAG: hypothetical protein QM820_58870 [Minicystis sp.]
MPILSRVPSEEYTCQSLLWIEITSVLHRLDRYGNADRHRMDLRRDVSRPEGLCPRIRAEEENGGRKAGGHRGVHRTVSALCDVPLTRGGAHPTMEQSNRQMAHGYHDDEDRCPDESSAVRAEPQRLRDLFFIGSAQRDEHSTMPGEAWGKSGG